MFLPRYIIILLVTVCMAAICPCRATPCPAKNRIMLPPEKGIDQSKNKFTPAKDKIISPITSSLKSTSISLPSLIIFALTFIKFCNASALFSACHYMKRPGNSLSLASKNYPSFYIATTRRSHQRWPMPFFCKG